MHALSDEQQVERLEARMDRFEVKLEGLETRVNQGFAGVRSEARGDYRTLLGIILAMFGTMILGFAALLAGILTQAS